jgi:effector-binding domain-containing protein
MEITIRRLAACPTACVRVHTTADRIGEAFRQALPKVAAHIEEVGGTIAGPPYARYHEFGPSGVDMEVGVPTAVAIPANGDVTSAELPAVEAAVTVHQGPYERLGETYDRLERWIDEHGHEAGRDMWEIYLTDPQEQPDPAEWRTEIVWPLKR